LGGTGGEPGAERVPRIPPRIEPGSGSPFIPFFLSYFWQIQRPDIWPVYYTSTVQIIETMNLWQSTGEIGEDYLTYKRLHETLAQLFSEDANRKFTLYDVEHVFWFKSGRLLPGPEPLVAKSGPGKQATPSDQSFDSYVPPIVAIIPRLASSPATRPICGLLTDISKKSPAGMRGQSVCTVLLSFSI
jgi:hypothetical protein